MQVIPAIDIRGGECVRLRQGDFDRLTVYGSDPVAMARRWEAEGAAMLHVVDLDGAKDGRPANLDVIRRIVRTVRVPVQVGGGIRTRRAVEGLLDDGAARVVVGTMAFEDRGALVGLLRDFGSRIVVALEAKDGKLLTRGWQRVADGRMLEAARGFEELGVGRILYTDISRDGTLTSPNYEDLAGLLGAVSVPVIASGGVSSADDCKRLLGMGLEAVIVGKALYEGTVTLREINYVG